jgi:D-alanyl-D-alanine endopeptidase (penicillin-binding protein 7)
MSNVIRLALTVCLAGTLVTALTAFAAPVKERRSVVKLWEYLDSDDLRLKSRVALVVDDFGNQLYAKAPEKAVPIASITKLMTAMVIVDAKLPMDEPITITREDRDDLRLTGSRLSHGATLSRGELLTLALMSSENRATAALGRTFPGGTPEIVRRMNLKALTLGLQDTRFAEPTGLSADNVSTARDLSRLVRAAHRYPAIREATTKRSLEVKPYRSRGTLRYVNTNRLVRSGEWTIALSKTGYINEAGRCLVMFAEIRGEPMVMVLLNSFGKLTPIGDANRVRKWVEEGIAAAANDVRVSCASPQDCGVDDRNARVASESPDKS